MTGRFHLTLSRGVTDYLSSFDHSLGQVCHSCRRFSGNNNNSNTDLDIQRLRFAKVGMPYGAFDPE